MNFKFTSLTVFLALIFSTGMNFAQVGGNGIYKFLNLPSSARVNALGGNLVSVMDDDVSVAYQNPGTLNPEMHNKLSFNSALYFAGIHFGYAGFARHYDSLKTTFGAGIQYITYGKFARTDAAGMKYGEFSGGEYAFSLGGSRKYQRINYGANLKFIYSSLETYNSFGVSADIGAVFKDSTGRFMAGAVMKNIGLQIDPYVKGEKERMPFEIQLGISKQLEHVPFRLSVVAHNLQQFNIRYDDPDKEEESTSLITDTSQTPPKPKKHTIDKIARHFIVGGEFLLGKSFRLRIGYNHLRRQELAIESRKGLSGFSFGAGLRISKFRVDYGLASFNTAGMSHLFSVSTDLGEFIKNLE